MLAYFETIMLFTLNSQHYNVDTQGKNNTFKFSVVQKKIQYNLNRDTVS